MSTADPGSAPPAGHDVLTMSAVRYTVEGRHLLDGVDLSLAGGEVVALIGPNGAGKSTALAVLAGDISPTSGSVRLSGKPVTAYSIRELSRRRSVLLQDVAVSFAYTVTEVTRMGRSPWHGTPYDADDDEVVDASMRRTDVQRFADHDVNVLSGGERARVALARVLAQQTRLMLLDEPTAALDIRHQEEVLTLARRYAEAGGAVLVVLHDLNLAAAHADRVVLMRNGSVVAHGTPREVLRSDLLTEVYEYPIEVIGHPVTGDPLIAPVRMMARSDA